MSKTSATPSSERQLNKACHSYLLRLWSEGTGAWQASLQDARTGEKYQFANLKDLLYFMEVKTGEMEGG